MQNEHLCGLSMVYYLSLGSNLGNRSQNMDAACRLLEERVGTILRRSSDFYSMPWGYESEHEYLNICVALCTDKQPLEVLHLKQQIERDLGRTEKNVYHDRTMDIDLILAFPTDSPIHQFPTSSLPFEGRVGDGSSPHHFIISSLHHSSPSLTLPHPRMLDRAFVLTPLREILC